eukprot:m.203081 g.203081  ORF g.203081 m.203081 type:complete len:356 (+) comp17732_c0_seq2:796-1863(+)
MRLVHKEASNHGSDEATADHECAKVAGLVVRVALGIHDLARQRGERVDGCDANAKGEEEQQVLRVGEERLEVFRKVIGAVRGGRRRRRRRTVAHEEKRKDKGECVWDGEDPEHGPHVRGVVDDHGRERRGDGHANRVADGAEHVGKGALVFAKPDGSERCGRVEDHRLGKRGERLADQHEAKARVGVGGKVTSEAAPSANHVDERSEHNREPKAVVVVQPAGQGACHEKGVHEHQRCLIDGDVSDVIPLRGQVGDGGEGDPHHGVANLEQRTYRKHAPSLLVCAVLLLHQRMSLPLHVGHLELQLLCTKCVWFLASTATPAAANVSWFLFTQRPPWHSLSTAHCACLLACACLRL